MPKKVHHRSARNRRRNTTTVRRTATERAAARRGSVLTRKRHLAAERELAPVVQLPRFGQDDIAAQLAAADGTTDARRPAGERTAKVSRWLWRHRWQLTPAATSAATMAGAATAAPATTLILGGAAAAAHTLTTRGPDTIGGRTWLSRRERGTVSRWTAGAAAWTACVEFGLWDVDLGGALALAALTGLQTVDWLKSRKTRTTDDGAGALSGQAAALVSAWPFTIGVNGPAPLRGSHIEPTTVTEPAPGALTFAVELREDVHSQDATGDDVRRRLERALYMGIGTVELTTDRENSALVRVTLTPTRHLEVAPAAWEGPILREDGSIPLADERSGATVDVALFNDAGVEHAGIFGTTGGGKSNTIVALVLPGVTAGLETLWYIDGGNGTSAGHLTGAADWLGLAARDWDAMIAAAHTVMRARKERRAARGLSSWRGHAETDPVLTLCIDEATTVLGQISKRSAGLVSEILREGRKLGVRLIQCTQDPEGTGLIGGRQARGQMAGGGSLIAHRMGDGTANVLAGGSTSEQIDLRNLPPEAGWVAIIRRGRVLTRAARVRYATPAAVAEVLADVTPRALAGEDLEAAGAAYTARTTGPVAAARMNGHETATEPPTSNSAGAPAFVDASTDGSTVVEFPAAVIAAAATAGEEHSRTVVLNVIRQHPGGITPAELRRITGFSKTSVNRRVRDLAAAGLIDRDPNTGTTRPAAVAA